MIGTKARAAAALDSFLASLTTGSTPGTLRVYSGTVPPDLATAPPGTLLASINMGTGATNAFGATSTTTLVAAGLGLPWSGAISASGTGTYWRMYTGAGVAALQGTLGVAGSGAELIVSSTTFTAGGTFTVSGFSSNISGIT